MKLSEAIKKGAEKYPQKACRAFFDLDEDGRVMGCCALGTAYLSLMGNPRFAEEGAVYSVLYREWPWLKDGLDSPNGFYWVQIIGTRNDSTAEDNRLEIANWLESLGK